MRATYQIHKDYLTKYHTKQQQLKTFNVMIWLIFGVGFCYFSHFGLAISWFILFGIWLVWRNWRFAWQQQRLSFILQTPIPSILWQNALFKDYTLTVQQKSWISTALQDFFILHLLHPKQSFTMPSIMVDNLWHAFILDSKCYSDYCQNAFGNYFHHIPNYQFDDKNHDKLLFTWQESCRLHNILPDNPQQLPRLFLVDKLLLENWAMGDENCVKYAEILAKNYRKRQAHIATTGEFCHASKKQNLENDNDCNTDSSCSSCSGCGS